MGQMRGKAAVRLEHSEILEKERVVGSWIWNAERIGRILKLCGDQNFLKRYSTKRWRTSNPRIPKGLG
jgi:hypothetical protein